MLLVFYKFGVDDKNYVLATMTHNQKFLGNRQPSIWKDGELEYCCQR